MARRIARVISTLVIAAGLLFAALLILPAALGWQRYVIVSGSMTGTYDRGRWCSTRSSPSRTCAWATSSPTTRRRAPARRAS